MPEKLVSLKIGALFAVLVASVIGIMIPILRWRNQSPKESRAGAFWYFILRSYAAGVMLALAFVHIIADALATMDGLTGNFPIGSVFVMLGVMTMMIVERLSLDFGSFFSKKSEDGVSVVSQESSQNPTPSDCAKPPYSPADFPQAHPYGIAPASLGLNYPADTIISPHAIQMQHRVLPLGPVQDVESSTDLSQDDAKPKVMLGMLELGIVVHSVIIGMDLGVKTDRPSAIVGLVIALCFHQFFEGLGLGSCIANVMHDKDSQVNWCKVVMMVAVFSLTFPLGGALGMISIAAESFHADNLFQPWLQEDFNRADINSRENLALRWLMLLSVVLGATCMSLLALQA
ncbi:hypothetical protein GUITHDRAFT_109885 [Guillardia theta CCMP2712]|uniref:Zinc/iron permease n=1 Tax=Guillardia theta (strain CCMP2712) TaxID=905079 RepID=L1J6F4_GUITC|nr:hypothetical protein GUITHDRAFT_109885 [Guillardia theta CCMP2712]EKX44101.1 hypothetical protein GUITHDRAFT_109885 [Guillardia theta CCMP2712]|eukprot:XP_005831081.1 hypothetical protein GUITHDRAFT_109885 [Guillardia theta CCMP2712]